MGPVTADDQPPPAGEVERLSSRIQELEESASCFRRALTRLGDALVTTRDRPTMVAAALETSSLYLQARTAVFYLVQAGSERLRPMDVLGTSSSPPPPDHVPLDDVPPGQGIAGAAARLGRPVVWPGDDVAPAPEEPAAGVSTAVAVPLRPGGHTFGVLAFYGRQSARPFTPDEVEALSILARQLETPIDRSFLYDEATRLSLTDGLTGLSNRRHFDLRLEAELSRAVRFSETFTVVLTDVDRYKPVNDTYGHQAGDTVLVELAGRLAASVREVDLVARFGGDEFALLLPKTGLAGALRLGDKMRTAVASQPFRFDGESVNLTLSAGVAAYPEHGSSGKDLVAAADAALYRAKREGGDRVEHARIGERLGGDR